MLRRVLFVAGLAIALRARVRAGIAWWQTPAALVVSLLLYHATLASAVASDLTATEVQQIARFAGAAVYRDMSDEGRARVSPEVQARYREARDLLPGRGPAIAQYFLMHEPPPPSNDAYFFVFEALADTETALILIHALTAPLADVSTKGKISDAGSPERVRDNFQIEVAIEAVLVNDRVRSDPRVAQALIDTIARLREKPWDPHYTQMAVSLLGRCSGPAATLALQQLATDGDAALRNAAIQALGQVHGDRREKNVANSADQSSSLATFTRTLNTDNNPAARASAATALGNSDHAESTTALRAALAQERQPQVVDAIVLALHKRAAPFTDSALCRELVSRTWDIAAARVPFDCWRVSATRAALIDAATRGSPQLRALCLAALVESHTPRAAPALITLTPALPHAPQLAGATAMQNAAIPLPAGKTEPALDPVTQQRLLASAVEILSMPSAGTPVDGAAISDGAASLVNDALWEISGHNMPLALAYADRVTPASRRYSSMARYGASYRLWNKDKAAYVEYRRPRQALVAVITAAFLGVLLWWEKTRHAGALLVVAVLGWGIFTGYETDIAGLPPPPLQLLSVAAIGFLCAGLSTATSSLLWPTYRRGSFTAAIKRSTLSTLGAALLAFAACIVSRGRYFPIGGEGWELIFDPVGAALTAALAAIGLLLVDGLILRRLLPA